VGWPSLAKICLERVSPPLQGRVWALLTAAGNVGHVTAAPLLMRVGGGWRGMMRTAGGAAFVSSVLAWFLTGPDKPRPRALPTPPPPQAQTDTCKAKAAGAVRAGAKAGAGAGTGADAKAGAEPPEARADADADPAKAVVLPRWVSWPESDPTLRPLTQPLHTRATYMMPCHGIRAVYIERSPSSGVSASVDVLLTLALVWCCSRVGWVGTSW
jgi:hypothetical protein